MGKGAGGRQDTRAVLSSLENRGKHECLERRNPKGSRLLANTNPPKCTVFQAEVDCASPHVTSRIVLGRNVRWLLGGDASRAFQPRRSGCRSFSAPLLTRTRISMTQTIEIIFILFFNKIILPHGCLITLLPNATTKTKPASAGRAPIQPQL